MDLIGLHGKGRSGKDTVYQMVAAFIRYRPVVRDAFADRLKDSAAAALDLPREQVERLKEFGSIEIETGTPQRTVISGRSFLERYGTEAHRDIFGASFWVDQVMDAHRYRLLLADGPPLTVITDVRYENEVEAIKAHGGQVWKVRRPGQELESGHATNQLLSDSLMDQVLWNDGDLDLLRSKVCGLLDHTRLLRLSE